MIELKKISKSVTAGGNKIYILKDIDLRIQEGEFIRDGAFGFGQIYFTEYNLNA